MVDWKGNKIEVGQTVIIVNVKSMFGGSKSQLMLMTEKGIEKICEETTLPEGYQWTIVSENNIIEPSTNVTISMGSAPSKIPINQVELWLSVQSWQILCIKGVSDSYEDYYKEYFKV
jgi:hypothetical protein